MSKKRKVEEPVEQVSIPEAFEQMFGDNIQEGLLAAPVVETLPESFGSDISDDWLTNMKLPPTAFETKLPNLVNHPNTPGYYFDSSKIEKMPIPTDLNFNEIELIREIENYILSTYQGHYSGKYQATDIIIDAGHGIGFTLGNVIKYAKRYGKKEGFNRKDLLKMVHYGILALYVHDYNMKKSKEPNV